MSRDVVDALGDLITDYLGVVADHESNVRPVYRGIYSIKELRVMHTIFRCWRRGISCTVTQVANETGISKTTVSRAVTGLMTSGLLTEEQDPEDGRRRLLRPTSAGQQTIDNIDAWLNLWADRLLETVAGAEPSIVAPEPTAPARPITRDAASG